jgi:thioredoxin-like negative regulator of GroEL
MRKLGKLMLLVLPFLFLSIFGLNGVGRVGWLVLLEELAGDYDGKVKFVKINVDDANALASKYNVFSIPTLMIFNKGEIVAQQVGAASKDSYKNMIDKVLGNL